MSRKTKRATAKAKRGATISKLSLGALTIGDWSIICASLIHERDKMFAMANGEPDDRVRAATFDDKGWRINAVLVRLDHPAALKVAKEIAT